MSCFYLEIQPVACTNHIHENVQQKTAPKDEFLITVFNISMLLNTKVSQGNVASRLSCDEIFIVAQLQIYSRVAGENFLKIDQDVAENWAIT